MIIWSCQGWWRSVTGDVFWKCRFCEVALWQVTFCEVTLCDRWRFMMWHFIGVPVQQLWQLYQDSCISCLPGWTGSKLVNIRVQETGPAAGAARRQAWAGCWRPSSYPGSCTAFTPWNRVERSAGWQCQMQQVLLLLNVGNFERMQKHFGTVILVAW